MKQFAFTFMLFVIVLSPLAAVCQRLPDELQPAPDRSPSGKDNSSGGRRERVLQRGVLVNFTLLDAVSSATARKGQAVRMAVAKDVIVVGQIMIPAGTPAIGQVGQVGKAIRGKRDGYVSVFPTQIAPAGGRNIRINEDDPSEDMCSGPGWAFCVLVSIPASLAHLRSPNEKRSLRGSGVEMTLLAGYCTYGFTASRATLSIPADPPVSTASDRAQ